jgi:anaerobic selenocysteine-containing dehydrogenase
MDTGKAPNSFRLLHGKQAIHSHAMTANQPYLMQISRRYDLIRLWMNRRRGEQLGLNDGDLVEIKSLVGEGKTRVKLTEGIHPSCVWLPSGYGVYGYASDTSGAQTHSRIPAQAGPSAVATRAIKKARAACPDGKE